MAPTITITDRQLLKQFADHLRGLREARGLSLEAMAAQCDMDASALADIEAGNHPIDAVTIAALVDAYGIEADGLLEAIMATPKGGLNVHELKQSFLKIDSPNRGKMFQDFIAQLPKDTH